MSILYSGKSDGLVSLDQMKQLPPAQVLGPRHNPQPFHIFIDNVIDGLQDRGYEITESEFSLTDENNKFFGAVKIDHSDLGYSEDHSYIIGLRGSHDQTFGRGLACGTQVMVCSNLCFSGSDGQWSTKQTLNIGYRTELRLDRIFDRLPMINNKTEKLFDKLKQTEITIETGDHYLAQMAYDNVINGRELSKAVREWRDPSFDDHKKYGQSLWQLFNGCTEAIKPTGKRANNVMVKDKSIRIFDQFQRLAA